MGTPPSVAGTPSFVVVGTPPSNVGTPSASPLSSSRPASAFFFPWFASALAAEGSRPRDRSNPAAKGATESLSVATMLAIVWLRSRSFT